MIPAESGQKSARETKSFKTKTEAARWLSEQTAQVSQDLSANNYELTMPTYIKPYFGNFKVRDIKLRDVNAFYARLSEQGRTHHRIPYTHRVLHAMLEDAMAQK